MLTKKKNFVQRINLYSITNKIRKNFIPLADRQFPEFPLPQTFSTLITSTPELNILSENNHQQATKHKVKMQKQKVWHPPV